MMSILLRLKSALSEDDPRSALTQVVKQMQESGVERQSIMWGLINLFRNEPQKEIVMDFLESFSPAVATRFNNANALEFQDLFREAFAADKTFKTLNQAVADLRSQGVDNDVLLLELMIFEQQLTDEDLSIMVPVQVQLKSALGEDDPLRALEQVVNEMQESGVERHKIVSELVGLHRTEPEKEMLMDFLESFSPDVARRLKDEKALEFQDLFKESLTTDKPSSLLGQVVVDLRAQGIEKEVILFELNTLYQQLTADVLIDAMLDVIDALVGWVHPSCRID